MAKKILLALLFIIIVVIIKQRFFDFTDYTSMIKDGAIIVDVRSETEFLTGNIDKSINIPVSDISSHLNKLKDKEQVIITCCASGIRSAAAKQMLISKGYKNVINGGGWSSLKRKIK